MAFGQQSGSPATARQMQELLGLLHEAGHTDFRDARGPMGFNQRQAGGKFSRDEADAFIEQLQQEVEAAANGEPTVSDQATALPSARPKAAKPTPRPTPRAAGANAESPLAAVPAEELAAELQRRGWIVVEP